MEKQQIIIYKTKDNRIELEINLQEDTIWLTQEQMALLFEKSQSTINEHIKNIYKEKELEEKTSLRKFGNSENSLNKPTNYYNLNINWIEF